MGFRSDSHIFQYMVYRQVRNQIIATALWQIWHKAVSFFTVYLSFYPRCFQTVDLMLCSCFMILINNSITRRSITIAIIIIINFDFKATKCKRIKMYIPMCIKYWSFQMFVSLNHCLKYTVNNKNTSILPSTSIGQGEYIAFDFALCYISHLSFTSCDLCLV